MTNIPVVIQIKNKSEVSLIINKWALRYCDAVLIVMGLENDNI